MPISKIIRIFATLICIKSRKRKEKMAVIGKIRKHSAWIAVAIVLAIVALISQDAFLGDTPGRRIPRFAVINGQEIQIQQFDERVRQVSDNFQLQQGGMPLSQEDMHMVREHVWETMVGEILLTRSIERLGITVTNREMNDMFYGQFIHRLAFNAFTDPATGMFNRQQVMMLINNFHQMPIETQRQFRDLEILIREDRLRNKYYALVLNAHFVPTFFANYMHQKANSSASVTVAALNYAEIPDSDVTLTDADFRRFFNNNRSLFYRTQTMRAVDFIVFDVLPTEADMLAISQYANELFEEFKVEEDLPSFINAVSTQRFDSVFLSRQAFPHPWDSLLFNSPRGTFFAPEIRRNQYEMAKLMDFAYRPDSVRASHILITYRGSAANQGQIRTRAEAESIADSLRREVLRDRTRFAEIAFENSEDGSAEVGGDLGWFFDGQMVAPFNEAVVNGRVGDIVVVETMFGFHVIHVTGRSTPVRKAMAAFVFVPIEPSEATNRAVYAEVSRVFARSRDLTSLQEVARAEGLHIRQAEFVTEMDAMLPGLPNARNIVRWAYDRRTRVGDVAQEIFEFENRYVIAALRQIREKGYPTLAEIQELPEVQFAVRNEVKAEKLIQRMNSALSTNRSISALEAINADVETVDFVTFSGYNVGTRGFEPELIGTVFGTAENRLSNPIRGRSGVFVAQPLRFTAIAPLENIEFMRQQMQFMFERGMLERVRSAKESNARIVENRAFYF